MAKRPLTLEWTDPLPGLNTGDSPPPLPLPPPPSLYVVAAPLSDLELHETIQRISDSVANDIADELPDKGRELQSILRQVSVDIDRNQKVSGGSDQTKLGRIEEGLGACVMSTESSLADIIDDFWSTPDSDLQEKFEDKEDASYEELRFISHDKYRSLRENHLDLEDEATVSSGQLATVCYTKNDEHNLFNEKLSDIRSSSFDSSQAGKTLLRRSSKRRRAPSKRVSSNLKFEHVVLLDDEDVEPQPKQKADTSDNWCDPECVELSYLDLRCLNPESYLSSSIMNFYIEFLQRPASSMARQKGECYIFNTYFYSKLEEAMTCKGDRTTSFLKLRRWWKGVDIFQKAYLFLPIHGGMHWSLVIICIPAKEDESGLLILHLDSLGVHSSYQIFSIVSRYLKEEWNYIILNDPPSDLPVSEKIWNYLPCMIQKEKVMVPQQKNEYDCGIFVLYFIKRFLEEAPERLGKQDLFMFGKTWFDPEEASKLRNIIHGLILNLLKTDRLENASHVHHLESKNDEEECSQIQLSPIPENSQVQKAGIVQNSQVQKEADIVE